MVPRQVVIHGNKDAEEGGRWRKEILTALRWHFSETASHQLRVSIREPGAGGFEEREGMR